MLGRLYELWEMHWVEEKHRLDVDGESSSAYKDAMLFK
jgi:hypothetical protein